MNAIKIYTLFVSCSALALSGCVSVPAEKDALGESQGYSIVAEQADSTGVLVLESTVVGKKSAYTASSDDSDCVEGYGLGVMTSSTQGDSRFLFDRHGKPCVAAKTLFDGKLKVNNRAADPAIKVAFLDKYGEIPSRDSVSKEDELLVVDLGDTHLPEEMLSNKALSSVDPKAVKASAPLSGNGDDFQRKIAQISDANFDENAWEYQKNEAPVAEVKKQIGLQETIQKWHAERERKALVRDAEKLLAGARNLERKSSHELIGEHQKEISTLLARLRESEKLQAFQREREKYLQDQIVTLQASLLAQSENQTQKESALEQEISVMAQRAEEFKVRAQAIQEDKQRNEVLLSNRISSLKEELRTAEANAEVSQQKLLLDAAQQLAQAEAATQAYHAKRRESLEKRAEQKEREASYLTAQAQAIEVPSAMSLPMFSEIAFMETPESKLEERLMLLEKRVTALQAPTYDGQDLAENAFAGALVNLNVKDQPLDEILRQALAQAMPGASWELVWELSKRNASIKDEKWTVIAEARMDEILAYIREKVKKAHAADIEFRRFDKGTLFVVSDMNVTE